MPDIFELKNSTPMLMHEESSPFDSPNHIYELKLDGIRALAYLDGSGTVLRNKRNKELNAIYPELTELHRQAAHRCILDGELVAMGPDGKPDFAEIQRRSLMTNSIRISFSAKLHPVRFVAFDILYSADRQVTDLPLLSRKALLEEAAREGGALALSRFIHEKGMDLYNLTAAQALEGVVAKRNDSLYHIGKRTKDWIKFKHKLEDDFVICGYMPQDSGGNARLVLGAYRGGELVEQGSVAFTKPGGERDAILEFAAAHRAPCPFRQTSSERDVVWVEPQLVCTVEYLTRALKSLRQANFKALEPDKEPKDCIAID